MIRPGIFVRLARATDVADLTEVWSEARAAAGAAGRVLGAATEDAVAARLVRIGADADKRLFVAERDGRVVGVCCVQQDTASPLDEEVAVRVAYLHVLDAHRRNGVGSALLEAAADFAEECGAASVIVAVPQELREANRFYARLGLVPAVAHRTSPTAALRRRLERTTNGRLHEVLSQRRLARALLSPRVARLPDAAPKA